MKSQVLHTVWCCIPDATTGGIFFFKNMTMRSCTLGNISCSSFHFIFDWSRWHCCTCCKSLLSPRSKRWIQLECLCQRSLGHHPGDVTAVLSGWTLHQFQWWQGLHCASPPPPRSRNQALSHDTVERALRSVRLPIHGGGGIRQEDCDKLQTQPDHTWRKHKRCIRSDEEIAPPDKSYDDGNKEAWPVFEQAAYVFSNWPGLAALHENKPDPGLGPCRRMARAQGVCCSLLFSVWSRVHITRQPAQHQAKPRPEDRWGQHKLQACILAGRRGAGESRTVLAVTP